MGIQQLMLGGGGKPKLYREDLFNSYLFTGNGSTSRGINMGVDLTGAGGFVWTKNINDTNGDDDEGAVVMYDTVRGATKGITLSGGSGEGTHSDGITAFTNVGYTTSNRACCNENNDEIMSYAFRKEPKFMDIQVVDCNSETPFMVNHDLGVKPAFIMMKRTSGSQNYWRAWHKDLGNTVGNNSGNAEDLNIHFSQNGTGAEQEISGDSDYNVGKDASATQVRVPRGSNINGSSGKIIIIMFASHDGTTDHPSGEFGPTGDQDIIKCGYYTANGNTGTGGPLQNLGWDPEFLIIGRMSGTYGGFVNIFDQTRGMGSVLEEYQSKSFRMSEANPGQVGWSNRGPSAWYNGFRVRGNHYDINKVEGTNNRYWYVAIRRADGVVGKEPTSANRRFDMSPPTSTTMPSWTENFRIDASIRRFITSATQENYLVSRVTGREFLLPNKANDSSEESDYRWEWQYSAHTGNVSGGGTQNHYAINWHRSNSFDTISYKGDGSSSRVLTHNMGTAPEMIWIKGFDQSNQWNYNDNGSNSNYGWICWHKDLNGGGSNAANYDFELNNSGQAQNNTDGFKSIPTSTQFTIGNNNRLNMSDKVYIAWLFSSVEGECKIGSFTAPASSSSPLDVDFGFNPKTVFLRQASNSNGSHMYVLHTGHTWATSSTGSTKTWYLNHADRDWEAWGDAPHRITNGIQVPTAGSGNDFYIYYAHA